MSVLELRHLIGRGRTRDCYLHPLDSSKCVKVVQPKALAAMEDQGWNVNRRELDLWQESIEGDDRWRHFFPTMYGFEATHLGEGLVCEVIRDDDGDISQGLKEFQLIATPEEMGLIRRQIKQLKAEVIKRRILITDWHRQNYLVQRCGGELRLRIIDFQSRPNTARFFKWLKSARKAHRKMPSI